MSVGRFTRYAWALLFYNVFVIIGGAYVRASGSGAGCGSHWPACNGQVIPSFQRFETTIEFAHRVSSGLVLPLILFLMFWAWRLFPKSHSVRKASSWSLGFTAMEALVGAGLVKFGLVEDNDTVARAIMISFHLANTFFLLGSLTLVAWLSSGKPRGVLKSQGAIAYGLLIGVIAVLVLGISGAVTALGDTLFPSRSFIEGLRQDFSPTAHFLIRLRFLHPLIATSVGIYLVFILGLVAHLRPSADVKKWGRVSIFLFAVQLAFGLVNLGLRAPIEGQLIHLFLADALWISIVLAVVSALSEGLQKVEMMHDGGRALIKPCASPAVKAKGVTLIKQYIALTKPRVISLLLFTTLAGMFIAKGGWPGFWPLLFVTIGGYMAAGGANAINMVIDRDIDGKMDRTAKRPTVTEEISSSSALIFAFGLAGLSFIILWLSANLLSAMLALAGLAFYVVVYTLMLKRRTWHNIVIGGAAGAFPPLVGYAAVSNHLTPLAWCLFAIIFAWTPMHFWALALVIQDEYKKVGVPMLPVIHGDRATVIQIVLYGALTALISLFPFVQKDVGWAYLVVSGLLNGILLVRCLRLYRNPERNQAMSLFKYSMVYLAIIFLMIAIDHAKTVGA